MYNYNTLEQDYDFEAHGDFIRSVAVHSTQPYLLTCGDDTLIKLWNWEQNFTCQREFKNHTHYVMQVVFNPKDTGVFASASLDGTVRVWEVSLLAPKFTLRGHEAGVYCVDYYYGKEESYLVSGGDDGLIKIWDFHNRTCIRTLKLHTQSVTAVCCLPRQSLLLTTSEDGIVGFWITRTYQLKSSVSYGMGRAWATNSRYDTNMIAIGFDEGVVMIKVRNEKPLISMDVASGKITFVEDLETKQINLKIHPKNFEKRDGEVLPVTAKVLGSSEFFPKSVLYSPNCRFLAIAGEGEYMIYTSVALRSKAFGAVHDFAWAYNGNYAVLLKCGTVQIYSNFESKTQFKPEYEVLRLFGGRLLGVETNKSELTFYDWRRLEHVIKMEVQPRDVYWSDNGDLVCIAGDDAFYILGYKDDATEDPFTTVSEVLEKVTSGVWFSDSFIYTDSQNNIKYFSGGETSRVTVLDRKLYIIGYMANESRIYLTDKDFNIVSYNLPLSVLEYRTAVVHGDLELADSLFPRIPFEYRTFIAHFLEKKSFTKRALEASIEPKHQFELALSLCELKRARAVIEQADDASPVTDTRWVRLGNSAVTTGNITLAELCYRKAKDYSALLLLGHSTENKELLIDTARLSNEAGAKNVAFLAYFLLGLTESSLEILISDKKFPEAAFFARSYEPSLASYVAKLWRDSQAETKAGRAIANPDRYGNLFPEMCALVPKDKGDMA